jgi:hypothetical protein
MAAIAICGADCKVGATMISQSLAEAMAKGHAGKKILMATLDIAGEEYFAAKGGKGLESLRAAIVSNVLTGADLKDAAAPHAELRNLLMLRGPATYAARRDFFPEHAETLIRAAAEEFDAFIIDIGANLQTGLAIGALSKSDRNILVTTQQEHAFACYEHRRRDLLIPLGIRLSYLALNKHMALAPLGGLGKAKERYGIGEGAAVPWSDYGWQAEKERESLLHFGDKAFERGIAALLTDAAAFCGFEPPPRKKGLLPGNGEE